MVRAGDKAQKRTLGPVQGLGPTDAPCGTVCNNGKEGLECPSHKWPKHRLQSQRDPCGRLWSGQVTSPSGEDMSFPVGKARS